MKSSRRKYWSGFARKYSIPFSILLTSRLVVALAIVFASNYVGRSPGNFPEFSSRWYRYLLRWDAGWYLKIATEGYTYNGDDLVQHPVIFYPLYPLVSKILAVILGISPGAALLVVANVAIVFAVLLFYRFVQEKYGDSAAIFGTGTLCFFPASLFFSVGYTESLALLLIIGFFLMLERRNYLMAGVLAGLTTATRSTGVVLVLPLLIEFWSYQKDRRRFGVMLASIFLALSGLFSYMLYLHFRFNNALAFSTNIRAWGEGRSVREELFQALTLQPFRHLADVWKIGPDPNTLAPWFFLAFLAIIIVFRKSVRPSVFVFSISVLLLPYLSLSGSVGFTSFTRYIMLAFPVYGILGSEFVRKPWLGLGVVGVFAALLYMYTLFFSQWYFAG